MLINPFRPSTARHAVAVLALVAATSVVPAAFADNARATATPMSGRGDVVVEWNRTLLSLVQTPGAQPATIQPTRDFAVMSEAVYAAIAAPAVGRGLGRSRLAHRRSHEAAAAQAAHDVLTRLFPASATGLDQELAADLARIPAGRPRRAGIQSGHRAAADILAARATDGASAPPPAYTTTGAPGDYRPTPPTFAAPVFTHWGAVTPFVLRRADQFRPAAPPPLTSRAYAAAINEVERVGRDTSRTRTSEQTTIAQFWAAPIQNYWNAIADDVALAQPGDIDTTARTFALLDLGIADATIALYDAKYHYRVWRPITAVRLADTDGNRRTTGDPTWTPLATTPADPSYPGAHSTVSAAAATVLRAAYGDHVRFTVASPTLPGVTRSFGSFHAAVTEAGLSRLYAGVHTRVDHEAGRTLGHRVGRYTLEHALRNHQV